MVFLGGTLLLVSGLLEFVLGNTFPFVVFCSFGKTRSSCTSNSVLTRPLLPGGFWLAFGCTLQASFGAAGKDIVAHLHADSRLTQRIV
jgi:hypothetical protein